MRGIDFSVSEIIEESTSNDKFELHEHSSYEILFFMEGDSKFIIEEKTYFLEPGDVIIVRKHEMHRVYHNSNAKYHRIVLMINPGYFKSHNCADYEKEFAKTTPGNGNRINSPLAHSCGLYDAFMRLIKYSKGKLTASGVTINEPVIDSIITEILYLINNTTLFSTSDVHDSQIEKIIFYINNHFTEDINLQTLENEFYISKSYLCKIFKKATGLTIHDFISHKRLTKVREFRTKGENISVAARLAGFSDYASYYRACKKLSASCHNALSF